MSAYLCVVGATQTPVDSLAQCMAIDSTAYVMASVQTLATQPTLQDVFSIPIASDLQQAWELGFGLPMLCYVTAWAYGSLINFFDSKHEN